MSFEKSVSKDVAVDPVVMSASHEDDFMMVQKPKEDAVGAINAEAPVFFFFRLEFLRFERRMEGVGTKKPLPSFGFSLDGKRQFRVATVEFRRVVDCNHTRRRSRRELRRFVFPCDISCSARSKLLRKSGLKRPRPAASLSKRSRFISTTNFLPLDLGIMNKGIVVCVEFAI